MRKVLLPVLLLLSISGAKGQPANKESILRIDSLLRKIEVYRIADSIGRDEIIHLIGISDNASRRRELSNELQVRKRGYDETNKAFALQLSDLLSNTQGVPVKPFSDTLFFIYTRNGPILPWDRALLIEQRIQDIAADEMNYNPDSLLLLNNELNIDLVYKDKLIMTVVNRDGIVNNKSVAQVANDYRKLLNQAISKNIQSKSWQQILEKVLLALLAMAGVFVVIALINKAFSYLSPKILAAFHRLLQKRDPNKALLDINARSKIVEIIIRIVKVWLIVVACYLFVPAVFSLFKVTHTWSNTLLGWISNPVKQVLIGVFNYLPNLITITILYVILRFLTGLLHTVAQRIRDEQVKLRGFYPDWAIPTFNAIRMLLYVFFIIVIFPYLPGSGSPIFQGVSIFIGLLLSFGSTSAISNMVAGFVITYMRPFKPGDTILVNGIFGDVVEKNLLVTRIRTPLNEEVTISNSQLLSNNITNYSSEAKTVGLLLHTSITIGYDTPWRKVHEMMIEAAKRTKWIDTSNEPFVWQKALNDFFIEYQVNVYTQYPGLMFSIYSDLHQHLQDVFRENNIEIMSPHYTSYRNGNNPTVPKE